ncbi:WD repeat-containing protein 62 isoform X3 [Gadus morhua]|uniref:WD repeat-containing protein 62 isoform X3 n=1 Tax=Gadus morhua TaxID=8049 RepID=UPI0011B4237A|nr:WD repeat-containing protein 62-like isoform X3 [Gadus morhua]
MADQAEHGAPPPAAARPRRPAHNTNPNLRRRSRQSQPKRASNRVLLEKVLGITLANGSSLACDPSSGLVAYPAGCVIVLLHPAKNKQSHIINSCRKTVSSLAFSPDGKYLVSGESGHMPCVRVWDVCERSQLAEVQSHKYGVACVAFSPSSAYIVSVGYQHDMTVSVWEWKKGTVIASNKVSSGVAAVSFSEDSSSFVTAGKRHVKFWNLDASRERRVNSTVPLIGRSGLLGDFKGSVFCGVACGRGAAADNTYAVTSGGLLCLFNKSRDLEAWVHLKTASARCLAVSESFVFCGCSDGTVRVFSPLNLQFISSLPRPHRLGVQLQYQGTESPDWPSQPVYPDTAGLTFDPRAGQLTCVYNDHSVYVWDVQNILNPTKMYSALYHSGCVWSAEVYPEVEGGLLPASSFLTCSSDNTIRVWLPDGPPGPAPDPRTGGAPGPANRYSKDLVRVVYVGDDTQHLQDAAGADGKSGVRVLGVSPDGRHIAAGDRNGNLRVFGGRTLEELVQIEAHDSEVLCLEFSPADTDLVSPGVKLLASASRDRLIHIFNLENNFSLQQSLYDHSGSITAIKFTGPTSCAPSAAVSLVSCGADKSIYFRRAQQTAEGVVFSRSHHVVEKTTLYDMDLDPSRRHAAVACQDRNIRVYEVETGKLQRCLKGFSSDDGAVLKVQVDPSGCYLATSGSDRSISILDYETGETVVTLFGHSEIVTSMKFTLDCRYLVTVSGDSCVFLWRLDSQMTTTMKKTLARRRLEAGLIVDNRPTSKQLSIRRETFVALPAGKLPLPPTLEEDPEAPPETPARLLPPEESLLLETNGKLPMWFRKLEGGTGLQVPVVPRGRWAQQACPLTIYSPPAASHASPDLGEEPGEEQDEEGLFHPQSLDSLLGGLEEEAAEEPSEPIGCAGTDIMNQTFVSTSTFTAEGDFEVQAAEQRGVRQGAEPGAELSQDSAYCDGSAGYQQDDTDSLSQASSLGSSGVEEEEVEENPGLMKTHFDTLATPTERFDTDLRALQVQERPFLNPRLSISTRFLSRFQDRLRLGPPHSLPPPISEEPCRKVTRPLSSAEETPSNPRRGELPDRTLSTSLPSEGAPPALPPAPSSPLEEELQTPLPSSVRDPPAPGPSPQRTPCLVAAALPRQRAVLIDSEAQSSVSGGQGAAASADPSPAQSSSPRGGASLQEVLCAPAEGLEPFSPEPLSLEPPPSLETPPSLEPISLEPPPSLEPLSLEPPSLEPPTLEPPSLELCQQAAQELRQAVQRALNLQRQVAGVCASERRVAMATVLEDALVSAHNDLGAVCLSDRKCSPDSAPPRPEADDRTMELLERYSDLLLNMTLGKVEQQSIMGVVDNPGSH